LCGNHPSAAGIEVLFGPLSLITEQACIIAVTGAAVDVRVDGVLQGENNAFEVRRGAQVSLSRAASGARAYISVRGGIAVPPVLGSRARDTLGGIGPDPLVAGDVLPIGDLAIDTVFFEVAPVRSPAAEIVLSIAPGPHDDALDAAGWVALAQTAWQLDPRSDRIGYRLAGAALKAPASDLASFPVLPGCVQLPGDGRPVILGPDSGVTGGYPVLGVIDQRGLDALAQARPGAAVRLRRSRLHG
jgi:biotin-dependent carboxylase-like uncharacterized protein